jgi:dephospho-CoA kinase
MLRDGCSKEEVIKRMARQMPQDVLALKCDFLIQNDNQQSIVKQVLDIHKKLLDLSEDSIPFLQ